MGRGKSQVNPVALPTTSFRRSVASPPPSAIRPGAESALKSPFLAPVSTGWLRDPNDRKVSVNLTVKEGHVVVWAVRINPDRTRSTKEIYVGSDVAQAIKSANTAIEVFRSQHFTLNGTAAPNISPVAFRALEERLARG